MVILRLVGFRTKLGMAALLWRLAPRRARRVALGVVAVGLLWAVTPVALVAARDRVGGLATRGNRAGSR